MELEARAYGPDSSPQEIEAIEQRIYMHETGALYWHEIPIQSPFHVGIVNRRLHELSRKLEHYDLIIDLSTARPPDTRARAALREMFNEQVKLRRTAVLTKKNFMLGALARLVLSNSGLRNFGICRTLPEALESLRQAA